MFGETLETSYAEKQIELYDILWLLDCWINVVEGSWFGKGWKIPYTYLIYTLGCDSFS